jgi:hypothetical protein
MIDALNVVQYFVQIKTRASSPAASTHQALAW